MNKSAFSPRGRRAIPNELLQFGVHLVYAEGKETEPAYIENIKANIAEKYNCKSNDINVVTVEEKKTRCTVRLAEFARKDIAKRLENKERIDHVWIFFDKDDFPDYEEAHKIIVSLNDSSDTNADGFKYQSDTGIAWHSCPSNECFELWYCLYFGYYNVAHDRKDYKEFLESRPKLKKICFEYEKNAKRLHDLFCENGGSMKNAIKYAKRLEKENGIGNPSTGAYKFAEYFIGYMKN